MNETVSTSRSPPYITIVTACVAPDLHHSPSSDVHERTLGIRGCIGDTITYGLLMNYAAIVPEREKRGDRFDATEEIFHFGSRRLVLPARRYLAQPNGRRNLFVLNWCGLHG
jgi:hypothetical protein